MTEIIKEKLMRDILEEIKRDIDDYEKISNFDVINIYLGELLAFGRVLDIINKEGKVTAESNHIYTLFEKEVERANRILTRKVRELRHSHMLESIY